MSYGSDTEGGAAEGVGGSDSAGGYDSNASGSEPSSTGGSGGQMGPPTQAEAQQQAAQFHSDFSGYSSGGNGAQMGPTTAAQAQAQANELKAELAPWAGGGAADSAPAPKGTTGPSNTLKTLDTGFKTVMSIAGLFTGPIGLIAGLLSLANMAQSGAYNGLTTSPPTNPNTGPSAASVAPRASGFPGSGYAVGDHSSSYSAPVMGWAGAPANTPAAQVAPAAAPLPVQARLAPATRTAAPTTTASTTADTSTGALGALVIGGAVLALMA